MIELEPRLAHANDRTKAAVANFFEAYSTYKRAKKAFEDLRHAGLHLAAALDAEEPELADSIIDAVCSKCSPGIIGRRIDVTVN